MSTVIQLEKKAKVTFAENRIHKFPDRLKNSSRKERIKEKYRKKCDNVRNDTIVIFNKGNFSRILVIKNNEDIMKLFKYVNLGSFNNFSRNSFNLVFFITIIVTLQLLIGEVSCQGCGRPDVPTNAKVEITSDSTGNSEAKYTCDQGYELFGPEKIRCKVGGNWDRELPFCGINVAYRKPVNQSSYTRQGPEYYANDGLPGNKNPDEQKCSQTQKEPSPWWQVNLLKAHTVRVVRISTRGCCGHHPLQDLEIRVGNTSADLQRNPLCAWYPGTVDEGVTKTFSCARPLTGKYVAIQLVGVEASLSLCEVEVFSSEGISTDKCVGPELSVDIALSTFSGTCYEFHITRGENFTKAQDVCKVNGGDLIHNFRGPTTDFLISELERRRSDLKTLLIWIGAQKDPGITSKSWKWVNGQTVLQPKWDKDQPNNYNGEQNCVVLDGGRNWLWNDVGCNLDYLPFVCQHNPLSCGSPNSLENTIVHGLNYSIGNEITYSCPKGHALIGSSKRLCLEDGSWSEEAPTCQFVDCGQLLPVANGFITFSENSTTFGTVAKYNCEKNYTIVGNETRICDLIGWTGEDPKCLVNWCPEPPKFTGGLVTVMGRSAGSTAIYECDTGYIMIGEPTITCDLGGEWKGKPPSCKFVDCGAPVRPDHGVAILLNDSTTLESIVKYRCEDDFWLIGMDELKCTRDAKWSGEAPICELITCDTPFVPPGSYVVGYDYNVHSTIEYHCDPGHVLRGTPTLECLEAGEWSNEPPLCEYIDCKPLPTITAGTYKYTQNTTYVGSEVIITCDKSYKLNGPKKRICLESGLWSDIQPKCEEIRCPEPVLAPHSILSVTGNDRVYGRTFIRTAESLPNSIQTYKIGALAKYRCERGYKIVGDPLITCGENGQWNGNVPECVYLECGQPPVVKNGKVTLATNATYYGAAALYECDKDFKLDGISRRLCLEDGTWSHETPQCREITCPQPNLSEDLVILEDTWSVGSVAKFTCRKGRTLIGNATRECLRTGHWSGKSPICKPVDCGRPPSIENGRIIVINESTVYGGSSEYHCIPNYNRVGQYLRKCLENGKWSGTEPKCELITHELQNSSSLGVGVAIGSTVIILLLILIGLIFLHRNKARPVKNTENVQAAETKEDRNASVMSYSALDANNRVHQEMAKNSPATFNTFNRPTNENNNAGRNANINEPTENIYDHIPSDPPHYDTPYEIRTNEEVYEPEPAAGSVITINGISVR